ncbi:hypothetical protein WISP_103724 [Willisornis vidua]|uniref:Uncharacterized protein n=1 Tax=Willisornis vidua TaxID=1566151 RepID=A0ABQ9D2Z4_9PASS|nr:hypothetical protein WISP_103724 [Willisornis vidua]
MPVGSKTDPLLAKAESISDGGSASGIIFAVSMDDNAQAEFAGTHRAKYHFNSLASVLSALDPPQISSLIPEDSVVSDSCICSHGSL